MTQVDAEALSGTGFWPCWTLRKENSRTDLIAKRRIGPTRRHRFEGAVRRQRHCETRSGPIPGCE